MARTSLVLLLFGAAAVLALPQPGSVNRPSWWPEKLPWPPQHPESIQHPDSIPWPPQKPSWWPENRPWPPQRPRATNELQTSEDSKISHPEWIPWPPANWFPEEAPSWWPEGWQWPPRPSHPEWIPWPPANWFPEDAPSWWPSGWDWPPRPSHPEWIPWPPAGWFPEEAPTWWPEGWEWPPRPTWPPTHPESIPWPPANWFPEDAPSWWPEGWEWPPRPTWPPTHPESIPWPPANWFPEEAPSWWPENVAWPPSHPEWIPWPPTHPEWIPWPPTHPEWIPWPPQHPDWIPTNPDDLPYLPSRDNRFHLFTRANPSMSQPLIYKNNYVLAVSNFDASKRTVVLIHDLGGSATSQFNAILVPAILSAADVNVIIVDWSYGANSATALSTFYSVLSGRFVAYFIRWLSEYSNADLANFHLVGVGIGGLNAGFIGLNLRRKVGYITALDPPRGPSITSLLPPLNPNVALYTEVIHTDADESGYAQPLGDVDFYPNGGINQPGCGNDSACNRQRSVYFFAESIQTGGFTGVRCNSYRDALESNCYGSDTLQMGGLEPKTGSSGVFYVRTNAIPPFSQG